MNVLLRQTDFIHIRDQLSSASNPTSIATGTRTRAFVCIWELKYLFTLRWAYGKHGTTAGRAVIPPVAIVDVVQVLCVAGCS